MKKLAILVLTLPLIASCATKYVSPTVGPVATLHLQLGSILKSGLLPAMVGVSSAENFEFAVDDGSGCGEFKRATGVVEENGYSSFTIPANRTIFVKLNLGASSSYCPDSTAYFHAEENVNYLVSQSGRCKFRVINETNQKTSVLTSRAYVDPFLGLKVCYSESLL